MRVFISIIRPLVNFRDPSLSLFTSDFKKLHSHICVCAHVFMCIRTICICDYTIPMCEGQKTTERVSSALQD